MSNFAEDEDPITLIAEHAADIEKAILRSNITEVLRSASDMLWELRKPGVGPETYTLLHERVLSALEHVCAWTCEDESFKYRNGLMTDLYLACQLNGNVIPRLYMMVIAACALITDKKRYPGAYTMEFPRLIHVILDDLVSMLRCSQDPIKSLHLRKYCVDKLTAAIDSTVEQRMFDTGQMPGSYGPSVASNDHPITVGISETTHPETAPVTESERALNITDMKIEFYWRMLVAEVKLLTRLEYKFGRGHVGYEIRNKYTPLCHSTFAYLCKCLEGSRQMRPPPSPENDHSNGVTAQTLRHKFMLRTITKAFVNTSTLQFLFDGFIKMVSPELLVEITGDLIPAILASALDKTEDVGELLSALCDQIRKCPDATTDVERRCFASSYADLEAYLLANFDPRGWIHSNSASAPAPMMYQQWDWILRACSWLAYRGNVNVQKSFELLTGNMILADYTEDIILHYPASPTCVPTSPTLNDRVQAAPLVPDSDKPVTQTQVARMWAFLRDKTSSVSDGLARVVSSMIRDSDSNALPLDLLESILSAVDAEVAGEISYAIIDGLSQARTVDLSIVPALELAINYVNEMVAKGFALPKLIHRVRLHAEANEYSSESFNDVVTTSFSLLAILKASCECCLKAKRVKLPVALSALCYETQILIRIVWSRINAVIVASSTVLVNHQELAMKSEAPSSTEGKLAPPPEKSPASSSAVDEVCLESDVVEEQASPSLPSQESNAVAAEASPMTPASLDAEATLGLKYSLKTMIRFYQDCLTDLKDVSADAAFVQLLGAAALLDSMGAASANITYEFISSAVQVYETAFINSKFEVPALQRLCYTMYTHISHLEPSQWSTLTARLCTYSTRLLNDVDQILVIVRCALLFNKDPYRESSRCLECLQKCIRLIERSSEQPAVVVESMRCAMAAVEQNSEMSSELRSQILGLRVGETAKAGFKDTGPLGAADLAAKYLKYELR